MTHHHIVEQKREIRSRSGRHGRAVRSQNIPDVVPGPLYQQNWPAGRQLCKQNYKQVI